LVSIPHLPIRGKQRRDVVHETLMEFVPPGRQPAFDGSVIAPVLATWPAQRKP
jgi:hypothetical protein